MNGPINLQGKQDFEAVYEEWYDRVYKYAYTLLLNREDAEDVTADTFMAAYAQYDSYDPDKGSAGTWLTRIAHNRAVNLRRSAAVQKRDQMPDEWEAPDPAADFAGQAADSDTVMWLYSHLDPEERELLNMRYTMELSDGEIAEMLGLQKKTVNKRFQRLLQKCRLIMDGTE